MIVRERDFSIVLDHEDFLSGQNPFSVYWLISYCMLVGGSERFIIRSASPWVRGMRSEKLRAEIKKCFGQEANHAVSHDVFARAAESSIPGMRAFVRGNHFVCYRLLEKIFSSKFRLAAAAATEQLNTCIAVEGMSRNFIPFESGDLGKMLHWHYVEEIEHREVIFDLMRESGVSMAYRIPAAALVYVSFCFWISAGAIVAARAGGNLRAFRGIFSFLVGREAILLRMLESAVRFCRPSYHPRDELLPECFAGMAERV